MVSSYVIEDVVVEVELLSREAKVVFVLLLLLQVRLLGFGLLGLLEEEEGVVYDHIIDLVVVCLCLPFTRRVLWLVFASSVRCRLCFGYQMERDYGGGIFENSCEVRLNNNISLLRQKGPCYILLRFSPIAIPLFVVLPFCSSY